MKEPRLEDDPQLKLEQLSRAMPDGFDFYHLGRVESAGDWADDVSSGELPLEDRIAVGYRIQGDARGVLIVLFDRGLDSSMYMEMGNIIASRTATQLNLSDGLDVLISPPQILKDPLTRTLLSQASPAARRRYLHLHAGRSIAVETVILPVTTNLEGSSGNA